MPYQLAAKKVRRPNGPRWVVSLGRRYTGVSRQRRYFRTRKEAKEFVAQAEDAHRKLGCEAFVLPLNLRAEALACSQRLKALNSTLTQAVEFFILHAQKPEAVKPLADLKDEFLKSRQAM